MDILASSPGSIRRIIINSGTPAEILRIGGSSSTFGSKGGQSIIVTEINYGQTVNVQFMQTLRDAVYAYSFGDRMGDIAVNGLAFPDGCDNDSNGIQQLLEYYKTNRAAVTLEPIQIVFASKYISGFLIGMQITTKDTASFVHRFSLLMKTLPAGAGEESPGNYAGVWSSDFSGGNVPESTESAFGVVA